MGVYVQSSVSNDRILSYNASPLRIGDDGSFAYGFWSFASTGVGLSPKLTFGALQAHEDFFTNLNGSEFCNIACIGGGSGYIYGGIVPIVQNNECYQFYSSPVVSGWNSFLFVCEGTGIRHVYINGHKTTNVDMATKFTSLKDLTTGPTDRRVMSDIAWWGSGITDTEARMFGSGISPLMIARDRLHSYWPLYNTDSMYDELGNSSAFVIYTGTPSGANIHPPVRKLARPHYPSQSDFNTLNIFLKCGTSEDCLPYHSGDGAYSTAFGLAFDKQLCGNPPGWHMNLLLDGRQVSSGINDLYMYGYDSQSGIATMIVKAIDFLPDDSGNTMPTSAMNTYLRGPIAHPVSSTDVPFFMRSTTNSGVYKSALLYVSADASGQYNKNINFIVKNELSESYTSTINSFLKAFGNIDGSITQTNEIPIVVYNGAELESGFMTMSLYGPSGTDGAVPFSGQMNLFIHRGNESLSHTHSLYLSGPTQSSDDFDIYLEGQPRPTGTFPVYLFGGDSGVNDFVKLYTHGF